jgi:catechol 2,3-dioxygenase-like lactoylglutathione lyase family enzyme
VRSLLLIGALLMTTDALAQEPTVPTGERLTPMLRASVFVRDIDESLKLYRDILGLKPRIERLLEGDEVNAVLGTGGKSVRVAILQSGDTLLGNVGLFSFVGDTSPPPKRRSEVRTGDTAFIFITTDIQGIYEQVRDAGYAIVSPPMVLFPDPDAAEQDLEMLFFDADGVGINLIQRGAKY